MIASHRACRRVRALDLIAVGAVILGSLGVAKAADQNVDWTNQVNVAARGTVLEKIAGCQGCDDAGAVSRQMIRRGDGYAEFTVGEPNTFLLAGLSHADGNPSFSRIDFAFRFNGSGRADVLENGSYEAGSDTTYNAGDVFRVAIVAGRVQYSKNGSVLYESRRAPHYPLVLATSLGTVGATVRNARIETDVRAFTNNNDRSDRDGYSRDESSRLSTLDRNRDGVISRAEWDGPRREFNQLDVNRDGIVSRRELARAGDSGMVGTAGQMITVDATQQWTDSGIFVEAGDRISFDADGSVQLSDNSRDVASPAGAPSGRQAPNAPVIGQPAGALIARIGNSSPVPVGARRTSRAPVSGQLYLGINDDYFQDNRGQYRVIVTVERR